MRRLITHVGLPVLLFALFSVLLPLAAHAAFATGAARQGVPAVAVTHGPLSGEVSATGVTLWARGSQAGTLEFEIGEDGTFAKIVQSGTVAVNAESDFTGKARIEGLQGARSYSYRVSLVAGGVRSEARAGQFRTPPVAGKSGAFSFIFGSCLGGQGYCRNPQTGWVIFDVMAARQPDFFMLLGDGVYNTTACAGPNNVPGAEGPFTELTGMRSRYRYHLEDPPYARFLARTPVYVTWDDHEVLNDFSGPALNAINPRLLADGRRAFFDYWPLQGPAEEPNRIYRQVAYGSQADFFILDTRSYRDPNVNWDPNPNTLQPKTMLGKAQFAWLQAGLANSKATWKFIVSSVPLSYPTGFPQPQVDGRDGWANFNERSGFELELQALLFFIASHDVENVVFLVGDAHWPFALSYDPDRDGKPNFYELGSSPFSAIPLAPPTQLDPSFNPSVLYAEGRFQGDLFNFGNIAVDDKGRLTFRIIDWRGAEHYKLELAPQ